jgi:hypothetical protein
MDKREVLLSLQSMLNNDKVEDSDYIIESNQIDDTKCLTLITKENENFITTEPDYEAFINLLKYHNTKELNYVVNKFNDNKVKIFTEYSDEQREKFLKDIRDLHNRLLTSNSRNMAFIEMMITDWVDKNLSVSL